MNMLKNQESVFNGFNYQALNFLINSLTEIKDLKDLLNNNGQTHSQDNYSLKEKYFLLVMDLLKFINPSSNIRNWEKDWDESSHTLDYWKNKFFYMSIALKEKMSFYFNDDCKSLEKLFF